LKIGQIFISRLLEKLPKGSKRTEVITSMTLNPELSMARLL